MKHRLISWALLLMLVLAGCGQGSEISPMEPQVPPSFEEPVSPPENPSPNSTQPVEVKPLSTPTPDPSVQENAMPNPSDPEIQKLIAIAVEDIEKRFSIPADQVQFKEALEVTWPDSSLGCPNPSSMYVQVLTPGYLIRLQALDRTFEYHTDKRGSVIYCENPSALPLDSLPDH